MSSVLIFGPSCTGSDCRSTKWPQRLISILPGYPST